MRRCCDDPSCAATACGLTKRMTDGSNKSDLRQCALLRNHHPQELHSNDMFSRCRGFKSSRLELGRSACCGRATPSALTHRKKVSENGGILRLSVVLQKFFQRTAWTVHCTNSRAEGHRRLAQGTVAAPGKRCHGVGVAPALFGWPPGWVVGRGRARALRFLGNPWDAAALRDPEEQDAWYLRQCCKP